MGHRTHARGRCRLLIHLFISASNSHRKLTGCLFQAGSLTHFGYSHRRRPCQPQQQQPGTPALLVPEPELVLVLVLVLVHGLGLGRLELAVELEPEPVDGDDGPESPATSSHFLQPAGLSGLD